MTDKYHPVPDAFIFDLDAEYPIFEAVEMYLGGTGRVNFEDGTQQFMDFECSIFSPRLPEKELAAFCETNIDRYEAFHTANLRKIVHSEFLTMTPFW